MNRPPRDAAGPKSGPRSGATPDAGPAPTLLDLLAVVREAAPRRRWAVCDDAASAAYAAALDGLVARLHATLGRCLRGRLPDVDADTMADLVQEAVLHVIEGAASCRATTDDQVRSWACVVAIRAGLAFLRSAASGQAETRGALDPEAAAARTRVWAEWAMQDDSADVGALRMLARLAADAQDALPPGAAALVWDRVIEDASWAEAAARLGTTPPAAKRRFQRAQRALRRLLWDRANGLPEPARSVVLTRLSTLAATPAHHGDAPAARTHDTRASRVAVRNAPDGATDAPPANADTP